jgi:hypothetical protein
VQDRYAGDVGDFQKLGLLRALTQPDGSPTLRLGVCWYRTADEIHNADGKHIGYLQAATPKDRRLRECDPDLSDRLKTMLATGPRSVAALQAAGVLPANTLYFGTPLRSGMTVIEREAWHKNALNALAPAELVFLDPDNGLRAAGMPGPWEKWVS